MTPLCEIANRTGADKGPFHHNYTPIYHKYFQHLRDQPLNLLELGFGGYQYPDRGGHGAMMWAEYFLEGTIITTDVHIKQPLGHNRIFFQQCSQDDKERFAELFSNYGVPQIIVDDASHLSSLTVKSFEILFPALSSGGIYVVEDVHTSYWTEHGFDGTPDIFNLHHKSTMNYFKLLSDSLNIEHSSAASAWQPGFTDEIESIHFYKQMIFIFKK